MLEYNIAEWLNFATRNWLDTYIQYIYIKASKLFKVIKNMQDLPPTFTLVSCLAYASSPEDGGNMPSDMSVDFQWTTWCYIPEDSTLR
jgi:hypothetical protein